MNMIGIVEAVGGRFSRELGIDLEGGRSGEIFKWFLASVLFGARISETIVKHTFRAFEQAGVTTPEKIERTGWDGLVLILDRGGYVRYDFKTATKLLELCRTLRERYQNDLGRLHAEASDPRDLEERLKALTKGIGNVTVNIFLRELRGIWKKAQPLPSDLVMLAAGNIGLISSTDEREQALALLQERWMESGGREKDFPDCESALLRVGKNYCRKKICDACPARTACRSAATTGRY